jgi:polysaccharide export outer membrane protein
MSFLKKYKNEEFYKNKFFYKFQIIVRLTIIFKYMQEIMMKLSQNFFKYLTMMISLSLLTNCSYPLLEDVEFASDYTYVIGPGDNIHFYVWGNPDLSTTVPVRPDGKITVPLVEDLLASGKTPNQLARDMEKKLATFVRDPQIVVMVTSFQGVEDQQIRVLGRIGGSGSGSGNSGGSGGGSYGSSGGGFGGSAGGGGIGRYQGKSLPYERGMTLLDVVIKIGGIDQFADGNRASVIRKVNGKLNRYQVRIDDLIESADLSANVSMMPGDILIVPEAFF